mgnify:CR=1 FL=1
MSAPQIYLIAEADGAKALTERLATALSSLPVASVLLTPGAGGAFAAGDLKAAVDLIQSRGAAALISDDATLARTLRADGVHLSWSKDPGGRYAEVREVLGGRAIVGVDAGRSRHDAMTLGEAGADYIAFGVPAHVEDRTTAFERQLDLVAWWSEIFEPPCVALDAPDADRAAQLAAAGADFVGYTLRAGTGANDAAAALAQFQSILDPSRVSV